MHFSLALLLSIQAYPSFSVPLSDIISELNNQLGINTNIIYGAQASNELMNEYPITRLIFNKPFNATQLSQQLNKSLLFVLRCSSPPYQELAKLELQFQQAHFLLITKESSIDNSWLDFLSHAVNQGYINFLIYTTKQVVLYRAQMLPQVALLRSSVKDYLDKYNNLENIHGHEVRVAMYINPPRTLIYNNKRAERIYGGYMLRFLVEYLSARNASLVPLIITNGTLWDCEAALMEDRVDICSDALATNTKKYELTKPIFLSYMNLVVANAQPLATYLYLIAPFQQTVWICLLIYMAMIVSLMAVIHWCQERRWLYSKFLLEALNSLIYSGFSLKDLRGRERYILFFVMFIVGYVYSTYYLAYLKSLLATEVYTAQINSFEELLASNISLMMGEYEKMLAEKYYLPEILWQIVRIVPIKVINKHRSNLDNKYAYMLTTDRLELYDYAQQFLRHKRMRRIPINFFFLYGGYPMRRTWFLKHNFSRAFMNAFNTGLFRKIEDDARYETIRRGFYQFLATEYYEVQALGLNYFAMPAIILAMGYSMALISFLVELLAYRIRKPK